MDTWRVAMLGDGGVGKTALSVQFSRKQFIDSYDPTIEDIYSTKFFVDGRPCAVDVIDTAGQGEYEILQEQWIREGQGFILVYSITSRLSFDRIRSFVEAIRRTKRSTPVYMLVGNMNDKVVERVVSQEDGRALAAALRCRFAETSAKTADNVDLVFTSVVRELRGQKALASPGRTPGSPNGYPHGPPYGQKKKKKNGSCIIM